MKKSIVQLLCLSVALFCLTQTVLGQSPTNSELFNTLKKNDSLLFNVGFNQCDMKQFETLLSEDLEFYHDKSGVETSKANFISNFKNGICGSKTFSSRRELVSGSLNVYPMHNNNVLYGAIQTGEHRFYERVNGQAEVAGSIAKFSHLWIKEDGIWRISRALSYNHVMPEEVNTTNEIAISEGLLKQYSGKYLGANTGTVIITKMKNALGLKAGPMELTIYPSSQTEFFDKTKPLSFEFIKDDKGTISKMIVRENGKIVEEAKRIN